MEGIKEPKAASAIQFDLRKKLADAFNRGRFFVTVTSHDPVTNTLNHYYAFQNFKLDDLMPSLEKIASDVELNELGKIERAMSKA